MVDNMAPIQKYVISGILGSKYHIMHVETSPSSMFILSLTC